MPDSIDRTDSSLYTSTTDSPCTSTCDMFLYTSMCEMFLSLTSWVVEGSTAELSSFGSRPGTTGLTACVERAHKVRVQLEARMRRLLVIKHRAESTVHFATLIIPRTLSNKEKRELETKCCELTKRKGCEKQYWEALKSLVAACNEYLAS